MVKPGEMPRARAVRSVKRTVSEWLSCLEVNNSTWATVLPRTSPSRTNRRSTYCRTVVFPSLFATDKGSLPVSASFLRLDFLVRLVFMGGLRSGGQRKSHHRGTETRSKNLYHRGHGGTQRRLCGVGFA